MLRKTLLLIVLAALTALCPAQDIGEIFKDRGEVYFTFSIYADTDIEALSRMVSIDDISDDLQVYAYANKKEFTEFLSQGFDYNILQAPGTMIQPRMLNQVDIKAIASWDFYPTYDAYVDMMYQFEADFPDICDVFSIGNTYEGRELLVARISDNVGLAEGEPEFLYTSTMHGDETTGYVLMLRLIDYLLNGYAIDPRLTNMVNEMDIYINPLANPDGTYRAGNSNIYGATRFNAHNVDLNRNYPDPEDGPHPDGKEWQIETMNFMDFAEEHHFVMSANIHGGAEVCNYPWDTWAEWPADSAWWVYVCREYADTVHVNAAPFDTTYMKGFENGITNGYLWYTIAGGRQDYMTYFHQGREFTLEISDIKLLPASQLPAHWDYNYRSFLNYMEQGMYGLKGRITDSATGDPLVAEVYAVGHEKDSSWVYSSLPEGNYSRLLNEGTYNIRFKASGYITQVFENVVINNLQTTILDVELVDDFSDVEELHHEAFTIYPNPATAGYIRMKSDKPVSKIEIFSMSGQLLHAVPTDAATVYFIDISTLQAGAYIMIIEQEGKQFQRKFAVVY
jgi:hypothetical protein